MSDFYMSEDKGFRMYDNGGADNGADQYFIIDTQKLQVLGVTDSPAGIRWSRPHVHVNTRGIEIDNIQIINENNNWYVAPIDESRVTHDMPEITAYIPGIAG